MNGVDVIVKILERRGLKFAHRANGMSINCVETRAGDSGSMRHSVLLGMLMNVPPELVDLQFCLTLPDGACSDLAFEFKSSEVTPVRFAGPIDMVADMDRQETSRKRIESGQAANHRACE